LGKLFQKAFDCKVSRRSFIKGSAVTAAGIGLLGKGSGLNKVSDAFAQEVTEKEGEWITAPCWHDCGGRNLNKVYVVDGILADFKTDDTHPDSAGHPQARACARGWAQRQQILGADRLKYPMKRKNWEPGGGKKELRGKDEWVRISWDEALDTVASELKRVITKYGNTSILTGAMMGSDMDRVLYALGGCVERWGGMSLGTWSAVGPIIGMGFNAVVGDFQLTYNDRMDLQNSQLIVLWGANPVTSSPGNPMYALIECKKKGIKFIFVDPIYTDSAQILADDWIPIRPATDHALILGMAYTIITEDDPKNNPMIDWDFLNRCTIGFDKDHLPEGADPKKNFKDYVLGTYDGVPKTPEWAAKICGVPPEKIRWFAREVATTEKVALLTGWGPARISNYDSFPQAFLALGCMTGHIGQPGRTTGVSSHAFGYNGGPYLVGEMFPMHTEIPPIANPLRTPLGTWPDWTLWAKPPEGVCINRNELWDAVLNGKYTANPNETKDINIQLIYHGASNTLNQVVNATKGIAAHRKVECVISHCYVLNSNSKYADIVLPVTTWWERESGVAGGTNRETLIWYRKVVDPLFEAKDEIWIAREVAKRVGVDPDVIAPLSYDQQSFNQLKNTKVVKEDGSYENLVTITPEDIAEYGVMCEPQSGRVTLKELKEKGIYTVPRTEGDNFGYIAYKEFREDPQNHPLHTKSGKFEIYSSYKSEYIEATTGTKISPIPEYIKPVEGYEDTFADWNNRVKGDYPLQFITTHGLKRGHSAMDNVRWLQRAFPNVLWLNKSDAAQRGIKNGDTILVSSRHGKILIRAYVTDRIMPGVTMTAEGGWIDYDDELGVDKGGNGNILTGGILIGQGNEGLNSVNVQVEKWTEEPLPPDFERPQRIIFTEEV